MEIEVDIWSVWPMGQLEVKKIVHFQMVFDFFTATNAPQPHLSAPIYLEVVPKKMKGGAPYPRCSYLQQLCE